MNNKLILFVEDDPLFMKAVKVHFDRAKLNVMYASNGAEAIQLMNTHDFALIVSDWWLPRMDGIQLLKYARSQNVHAPFVLISSMGTSDDIKVAIESDVDDFWFKHDPTPLIVKRIKNILAKSSTFFSPIDILSTIPAATIIIDQHYIIKDMYIPKTSGMDCLRDLNVGINILDFFSGIPEIEILKEKIDATISTRCTDKVKHTGLKNGWYETTVAPLNGKYVLLSVSELDPKRKRVIQELDNLYLSFAKLGKDL